MKAIEDVFNVSWIDWDDVSPILNEEIIEALHTKTFTNKEQYSKIKDFMWNIQGFSNKEEQNKKT